MIEPVGHSGDLPGFQGTCKAFAGPAKHSRYLPDIHGICREIYRGIIHMVKDKQFFKNFFTMLLLLMLQNIITLSVNLADNIMLGHYSQNSLAGAAAVNQIQFVYQQLLLAFGESAVILGSQYFGKKDMDSWKKIASVAMRFGLLTAVILFVAVSLFPHAAVSFFTANPAIIEQGTAYIRIMRFTYIFFAITQILLATLRSVGIVKIAVLLSLSTLGINCCINYTLIYGNFGAPALGITGAAIGTLTARIVEVLILLFFINRNRSRIPLIPDDYRHTDKTLTSDYIRIMLPILVVNALWGLNNAAQNAILGHMSVPGSNVLAANSAASNLFLIVKSAAVGACSAASFFVGKMIGEGRMKDLKAYARTMQILFVMIGITAGIILYFLRIPILALYTLDESTMALADHFLIILSVITVTMSYQMPTNVGIIKGGGSTKYCMFMDLISIWIIVLPISFYMAFFAGASPETVIWCLNADQIFKCVPAFIKCNFGTWAHKLTR